MSVDDATTAQEPALRGLAAIADARARILILGSFPGALSLQRGEYYAHPRNLFWRLLDEILGIDARLPYAQRVQALGDAGIALWDVLRACRRPGSLDSRIRAAVPNDLAALRARLPALQRLLLNGRAAQTLFARHAPPALRSGDPRLFALPSTSPANASIAHPTKLAQWRAALLPDPEPR